MSPTSLLSAASPAELGFDASRLERLRVVLQSEIGRGRLPGAVALIARRGKIALFEALGQQDPVGGVPMARDSLFRIYSMTKPIVSVAVMMLLEQGRLLLGDPVSKYLPEYATQQVAVERGGSVELQALASGATVQDLLRHTAGLTYEFLGMSAVQRRYRSERIGSRERSNAEFSQALAALPLLAHPATVWEYSRATDVLGRLVEVLGGQPLGEFLREQIFAPLGMHETSFWVAPEHHDRIAEPFARDPEGGVAMALYDPRHKPRMESGGGGLISTAMDYARFLQFMLNKGELGGVRLLGPRIVDWMTADHLGSIPVNQRSGSAALLPPGHGFGLGFAVRTAPGLASVPGSAGSYYWGGISGTTFFVDPAQELFALMLLQAPNQRELYRQLFRGLVYAALLD